MYFTAEENVSLLLSYKETFCSLYCFLGISWIFLKCYSRNIFHGNTSLFLYECNHAWFLFLDRFRWSVNFPLEYTISNAIDFSEHLFIVLLYFLYDCIYVHFYSAQLNSICRIQISRLSMKCQKHEDYSILWKSISATASKEG